MNNKTKIAVVGCGYWGTNHARTLSELGALSAVSDLNSDSVNQAAEKFNVPAKTLDEILADEQIDGIVFALPPHLHAQNAILALEAGKHVLIEKPIALNTKDAQDVVDAAITSGKVAMTGHILRYHSAFEKMLAMFKAGDLGELQYIHSHRVGLGKFHPKNDALWDIAPHDLSLILAVTGEAPTRIHGEGAAALNHLSDFAHLHLGFPSGVKAHVLTSRLNPYRERRLTLVGSKAMMSFDDALPWDQKLALYKHKIWQDDLGWQSEMVEPEFIAVEQSMPLTAELEDFINAIQTGATPKVTIQDGLEVVKILEAGTVQHES
ncbi:MAG: Gfo/Idh/MocA family oxidoreductase [Rhizobiaceae bacterium]|nr:Gfo/Idh/MocA family oxidoreductase [Rhizobiaceae bacterium]